MWVIDAEFGLTCLQNRNYVPYKSGKNGGCHEKIVPKTIGSAKSGYPLWQKMTMFEANGKESYSMISEVVELSKATLEASLFDVPAGYREVKDASEMYTAAANYTTQQGSGSSASYGTAPSAPSAVGSSIRNAANPSSAAAVVGAKVPGTIRIGLAGVKTAAVGEGVSAADLSAAVQNSLQAFLKGTKVEIVPLEAKLASALASEAKEKECDFVLAATASHKKGGGGGFGGFGKMLGSVVAQTGIGHTGSTAGNIAGQMATNAIVSASQFSGNIKNKDEISLDLKLTSLADNSTPIARVFKAKAKGDGDDIVSAIIEQAAQALLDAIK